MYCETCGYTEKLYVIQPPQPDDGRLVYACSYECAEDWLVGELSAMFLEGPQAVYPVADDIGYIVYNDDQLTGS